MKQHIYPIHDLREHVTDGDECWCNPTIDEEDDIVIHNAADERELFETGERIAS